MLIPDCPETIAPVAISINSTVPTRLMAAANLAVLLEPPSEHATLVMKSIQNGMLIAHKTNGM